MSKARKSPDTSVKEARAPEKINASTNNIPALDGWKGPKRRQPSPWKVQPHGRRPGDNRQAENEYFYYDEDGELYLKVERFPDRPNGNKDIAQSHWDRKEKCWKLGTKRLCKIPYMLDEIIKAPADQPIFICEGEKDAESVFDLEGGGLIATTNTNGAGNWSPELNRWFKGKKIVYIMEDNDAPGRRHALMVARQLVDIVETVKIVRLPKLPEHEDVSWWIEQGHGKEELLAYAEASAVYEKRVAIDIRSGETPEIARKIEEAMIAAELPILKRAGQLVEPIWHDVRDQNGRTLKVCGFRTPTWLNLAELVSKHAVSCFQRRKNGETFSVDPPAKVMQTILERGHWGFPAVVGILNSPTMRPDGSLLTEPGYDDATQLWHQPAENIELPEILEQPGKVEAEAALALLIDLLSECHFVCDIDRSVALAAIMTTVLRGAFPVVPMFMFHKPEAGTGATYLSNIIATLATGMEAVSLATATGTAEELSKGLSAAATQGRPILFLNNLIVDLSNPILSQMVTEGVVDIRPFGKNDALRRCDCRAMTVLANGNNISVVGELVRRALTCRLDAKNERPEGLTYTKDPIAMIKADRGKYLAAVFIIIRAFRAAGSPEPRYAEETKDTKDAAHLAGYADWVRFVQWPLIWLGQEDPVKSQEDARANDPERNAFRERLSALARYFTGKTFTAADVFAMANEIGNDARGRGVYKYQDLFDAYSVDGRGQRYNAKSIGRQLSADRDKRWDVCYIEISHKSNKTQNTYRVVGLPPGVVPYCGPENEPM